jgi:ClpP class serine protease
MKYDYLINLLCGTPQLMHFGYLQTAVNVLKNHGANLSLPDLQDEYQAGQPPIKTMMVSASLQRCLAFGSKSAELFDEPSEDEPEQGTSIAIIPVMGGLTQRQGQLSSASSVSRGYDGIKADMQRAFSDPSVAAISLYADGPGGAQPGNSELVRWIHQEKQKHQKPVWSFVDESAYSATYNIVAASDKIVTTRSGGVGSIGAAMAHVDQSKANKKAGLSVTYIYSGDRKIDGNPHNPLSDEAIADFSREIEQYAQTFREDVAINRDLEESILKGYEAGTFIGSEAIEAGLVDEISTIDDYYSELFEAVNSRPTSTKSSNTINQENGNTEMTKPKDGSDEKNTADPERFKAICMHPAAPARMEKCLELAAGGLPLADVIYMLDQLHDADKKVEQAAQELKANQDKPETSGDEKVALSEEAVKLFGDVGERTPAQASILNMLAPALSQANVSADNHDILQGKDLKKNAQEKETDPNNIDELVDMFGADFGVKA